MAFTQVPVTGTYRDAEGNDAVGAIVFTPTHAMRNGEIVVSLPRTAQIVAGAIDIDLAATDDPGTTPEGVTYEVVEHIIGTRTRRTYYLQVPAAGPVDLDTAPIAEDPPTAVVFPVPGPQGPAGPEGPEGPQGPPGADGTGAVDSVNAQVGVVVLDAADVGAAPTVHTHDIDDLNTTGTPSATTYLRGDGSWSTPAGGGGGGAVDSVNGQTGVVVLDAADVGATQVTVDGSPVATFDVDTTPVTPADIGAQPADTDLTTIAALTPTNGQLLRRVSGAWAASTLTATDVGLGNVTNTSDTAKPVSTAQQAALNLKADAADVTPIVFLTQAAYDALTPDPDTLYVVID